jgi:hypothetical protein
MKNKILIGIALFLVLFLILVRYKFKEKFEVFKVSISQCEAKKLIDFRKEKEFKIAELTNGDKAIFQRFSNQFNESEAIIEHDTTFSFLYLSDVLKYKAASVEYIECLYHKCLIDEKNESIQKVITAKEKEFELKYEEDFKIWYPRFKDKNLLKKNKITGGCNIFFSDMYVMDIDEKAWVEFEKFIILYKSEKNVVDNQNKITENQYLSSVIYVKNQLNSSVLNYFDESLSNHKSQIFSTQSEERSFNSSILGKITYNISRSSFDKEALQSLADDAFEEQWKYNSLSTGAMPYSYCFGAHNNCNSFSCSKITVRTGGGADVLVTIKDINGDVVRHSYIKGGRSFSFNVPDGEYQVFFYSGSGWNPNKFVKTTTCGTLRGGFVAGEEVTKDDYITLYSQQVTYELILQQNGNLSTQPSSKNEAF